MPKVVRLPKTKTVAPSYSPFDHEGDLDPRNQPASAPPPRRSARLTVNGELQPKRRRIRASEVVAQRASSYRQNSASTTSIGTRTRAKSELQKPSFTGRRHCQETPRTARAQERDFKKVTAELETLKQDYKNLENRYHRSQETLRTLESSIVEKQHCNEGLKAELELIYCRFAGMKEEINQAEDRCRQTSRTLEETTVELRATHRFLSQADTLSGADIIDMVDSLNSGIFQLAAGVAESWSSEFSRPGSPNWQQLMLEGLDVEAHRVTRGSIGEGLQAILTRRLIPGSELDPPDPTPIQIALQVCLVQCCVNIMVGWTFTKHVDDILRGLHTKLLGAVGQAVAGRLRSMTRAQTREQRNKDWILNNVDEIVLNVLIVSGFRCPDEVSKVDARRRLRVKGLTGIVDMALRLNTAIGEEVTSMDIIPLIIPARTSFDPATMDDYYGGYPDGTTIPGAMKDGSVIGTVGMGLQRLSSGGTIPSVKILLRPKVVLMSTMQELTT